MQINVDGNLLMGIELGLGVGAALGLYLGYRFGRVSKIEVKTEDLKRTKEEQRIRSIRTAGPVVDREATAGKLREAMEITEAQVDSVIGRGEPKLYQCIAKALEGIGPILNQNETTEQEATEALMDGIKKALIGATMSTSLQSVCDFPDEAIPFSVRATIGAEDQSVAEARIDIDLHLAEIAIPVFTKEEAKV